MAYKTKYQFIDDYISNSSQRKLPIIADYVDTINPVSAAEIKSSMDLNVTNRNTLNSINDRFTSDGKAIKAVNADTLNGLDSDHYAKSQDLNNYIATTDNTINSINADITDTNNRINAVSTIVNTTSERVGGVESDIEDINSHIEDISNNLNSVDTRVINIENSINLNGYTHSITVGIINASTVNVDNKDVNNEISSINSRIATISNSVQTESTSLYNALNDLDNQIQDTENTINSTREAIIQTGNNLDAYQPMIKSDTDLTVKSIRFGNSAQKIIDISYSGNILYITTTNNTND